MDGNATALSNAAVCSQEPISPCKPEARRSEGDEVQGQGPAAGMAIYGPRVPGSSCLSGVAALAPHGAAQVGRGPRGPEPGVGGRTEVTLGLLPAKKYKKVTGKEIYSDTLESTPMLEKEKFPQDYFPEVGHRRGSQPSAGLGRERITLQDRMSPPHPHAAMPRRPALLEVRPGGLGGVSSGEGWRTRG